MIRAFGIKDCFPEKEKSFSYKPKNLKSNFIDYCLDILNKLLLLSFNSRILKNILIWQQ